MKRRASALAGLVATVMLALPAWASEPDGGASNPATAGRVRAAAYYQQGQALDRPAAPPDGPRDKQAVSLYLRAAELGHSGAQVALANHFLTGRGTTKDLKQAMRWYGRAAEQGNGEAFFKLGAIHQRGGSLKKAYACYAMAATLGSGVIQKKARTGLTWLSPKLSTASRQEAEELATGWRLTIDR